RPALLSFPRLPPGHTPIGGPPKTRSPGSVALTPPALPGGFPPPLTPPTPTGTSTLTLTASAIAAAGTTSITITGTSGSLTIATTVSLNILAVTVPGGWTSADVGAVGTMGDASYGNGTFTIKAAGSQIYGSVDAMHFA